MAGVLRPGRYAALVNFYTDPSVLFAALRGECSFPLISSRATTMLFAPGIAGLCRLATDDESALWQRIAGTPLLQSMFKEGFHAEAISRLLAAVRLNVRSADRSNSCS